MSERGPMESPQPPTTEPVGSGRSLWTNVWGVFFEPAATFEDVAERPRWLGPLLILLAVVVVTTWLMLPMWVELQKAALAARDMTPEQRQQAVEQIAKFKYVGIVFAPIVTAIITAIVGFLFWGWATVTGAQHPRYGVAFAAVAFAGLIVALQSIAQTIVVWVKGAEQVAREGGPPTFGLGLFLHRNEMSGIVWGLLANVNFFSIWYAVVLAIAGVHALKMSKGSAWAFAVFMWIATGLLMAFQKAAG